MFWGLGFFVFCLFNFFPPGLGSHDATSTRGQFEVLAARLRAPLERVRILAKWVPFPSSTALPPAALALHPEVGGCGTIQADFPASPDEDQVWKRKEHRKWRLQPCGSRTGPQAGRGALLGVGSPWGTGEEGGRRGQPETQRLLGSQAPSVRRERGLGETDGENGAPGVRLYFIALKEKGEIGPGFEKK